MLYTQTITFLLGIEYSSNKSDPVIYNCRIRAENDFSQVYEKLILSLCTPILVRFMKNGVNSFFSILFLSRALKQGCLISLTSLQLLNQLLVKLTFLLMFVHQN